MRALALQEVQHPPWLLAHFEVLVCKPHANESLAPSVQHSDLIVVYSPLPRHWPVSLYCSHIIVVGALSCVADSQLVLFHLCKKADPVFRYCGQQKCEQSKECLLRCHLPVIDMDI